MENAEHRFVWLVKALQSQQVPHADIIPVNLGSDSQEAWQTISNRLRLSLEAIAQHVAAYYRLEFWGSRPPAAGQRLPEQFSRRYEVLAVGVQDGQLLVATSEPDRPEMLEQLRFVAGMPVRLVIMTPQQIALSTMEVYSKAGIAPLGDFNLDSKAGEDTSASIRLVNVMLREAIDYGASDIHIQPMMGGGSVRFRIDGVLYRMGLMPRAALNRVIGRFKAVAGMDTTDKMRPHDGHARVVYKGASYDLRLSTVPSEGAEKLVVRFLPKLSVSSITETGLDDPELNQLTALLNYGVGLLLVTGPTGSGKTTLLYAAINERNSVEVNITTVEDPVEYHIPRLTQIEVNQKTDLTFARALRAVLRQDPNIVLIGEIRDQETAEIAVRAAMTGHLVLATLHTNDAIGAVTRLKDLGLSDVLIAEALIGVSAQRLMRQVCENCAQPATAPFTPQEQWVMTHANIPHPLRAVGCEVCNYRGYKGRILVCQVFSTNETISDAIAQGASRLELSRLGNQQGMRSLAMSALSRVRNGKSTIEEAERLIGRQIWNQLAQEFSAPLLDAGNAMPALATTTSTKRVLLVAKNEVGQSADKEAIERAGYDVDVTAGGIQPGRRLSEENVHYDLLVIDAKDTPQDLAQTFIDMREALAGNATVPVLLIADGNDVLAFTGKYVLSVPRPNGNMWPALLKKAFALRDEKHA